MRGQSTRHPKESFFSQWQLRSGVRFYTPNQLAPKPLLFSFNLVQSRSLARKHDVTPVMTFATNETRPLNQQQILSWTKLAHVLCGVTCFGVAMAAAAISGCNRPPQTDGREIELVDRTVEVACGECQFKLPGNGCDLAIRLDSKAYFVDGSTIDDHGDAHAEDGLCNAIRKANVTGTIRNGRFQASKIELVND